MVERRDGRYSKVWKYFLAIDDELARCNTCNKIFCYRSSKSNLKKHVKKQHYDLFLEIENTEHYPDKMHGSQNSSNENDESESTLNGMMTENYEVTMISVPEDKESNTAKQTHAIRIDRKISSGIQTRNKYKRSFPKPYESPSKPPQRSRMRSTSDDDEDDEFYMLGNYIVSQLRKLSQVNAILAQEEIQSVLTKYKVHELSSEEKAKMLQNNINKQ